MTPTTEQRSALLTDVVARCGCKIPHLGHYDGDRQSFYCRNCTQVIATLPDAIIYTFKEALSWDE